MARAGRRQLGRWTGALALTALLGATSTVAGVVETAGTAGAAGRATATPVPASYGASYGTDPYQTVQIYPAGRTGSAVVLLVHGGGWASTPGRTSQVNQALGLQRAGFTVVAANYDTFDRVTGAFPLEVDDVVAAARWAVAHAPDWGADGADLEFVGGSAGGQLVHLAADRLDAAAPGTVRAVVTLSGALDLVALVQDVATHSVSGYLGYHLRRALACGSTAVPCTAALAAPWSPAQQVTAATCPGASLVVNDTQELMPVDQAASMVSALTAANCPVTEILQPGHNHSFNGWLAVSDRVTAFLAAH
jgi:acetyl esterase/lipase